ncbi:MAG: endonuclease [Psychroflexus halocasei]
MKKISTLLFLCFASVIYAQAPAGYYDAADGLTGYQLKTALNQIIDGIDDNDGFPYHQAQGYGDLYDAYAEPNSGDTDDYYENDGTVLDMYSENPNDPESYNYNHFSNNCGNYGGEGDCMNREHLVPQSTFNSGSPMKSDYFHVVPSDGYVNGRRSSHPFGEVTSASWTSTNGSKVGSNTFPGYNGTVFEPIDEFKGDIARAVLYFAIRYESEINGSWSSNDVLEFSDYSQFYQQWYIDLLLSWHLNDPVSQREIDRNNNGYAFQGNRNPLVDHPEYASLIWDPNPDTTAPTAPTNLTASSITNSSVVLDWSASTDDIGVVEYQVEQDNTVIGTTDQNTLTYQINGLDGETLYNFRVYAIDGSANVSDPSDNLEVTTLADPDFVFFEDFNDCATVSDNFISVSEQSSLDWTCMESFGENNTGSYQMNSYSNGQQTPSLDWLITANPIMFENLGNSMLSFYAEATFGNTELEILYSTDYDGGQNPSNFTWAAVPNINVPLYSGSGGNPQSFNFDNIDISNIAENAYVAFKYDTTNGEEATRWTVDNFKIESSFLSIDSANAQLFKIYPNPNKGQVLFIQSEFNASKTISIYQMNGQMVEELKLEANQDKVEFNLQEGFYIIRIKSGNTTTTKKLIVRD